MRFRGPGRTNGAVLGAERALSCPPGGPGGAGGRGPRDGHAPPQPSPVERDCAPEQGSHSGIRSNSPVPGPRHPGDTLSGESHGPRQWGLQSGGGGWPCQKRRPLRHGGVCSRQALQPRRPVPRPSLWPRVHLQLPPPAPVPLGPWDRPSPLLGPPHPPRLPAAVPATDHHPPPQRCCRPSQPRAASSSVTVRGRITVSANSAFGVRSSRRG